MKGRFPLWLSVAMLTGGALPAQQKVELLFAGDHLGDRAWPRTGETWLGLYRTMPGFRLAPTKVKVERVPDRCAGSATRISAEGAEVPYLLVRGHPGFRAGPVDTAFAGNDFLYPAQSLSVKIGKPDRWYSLQALGDASKGGLIRDYTVQLHSSEFPNVGHVFSKLPLVEMENTPNLQWAGDLDRDGRLDLLFRTPIGGHSKRYVLFLSSAASPPDLLKAVASFDRFPC
jgi:hypothetical protein